MATKLYGTSIALPAPFVAGSCDPVDARLVVENLSDITTNAGDTFGTVTDYCKIYEGIQVYVSSEKATYMYVGPAVAGSGILTTEAQKTDNWRKISSSTTSSDQIEEAINNAEQNAKDYADSKISALDKEDTAVNGQYVDSVSETDGIITVTRKPVTSTNKTITIGTANGLDVDVNIDDKTIVRDGETGKLSVASAALVQYVGADAIKVSEVQDGNKTISLAINTNDKVLTQSADGLLANINLTWDKTAGLKLIGKGGTEITVIPAADFIKDGMLEDVELKAASVEEPVGEATTGTFLVFTFNTNADKEVINLDVTSLIDVYTAGNGLQLSGKQFSVKLDASNENTFLTLGADGLKLSGVQTAIDGAVSTAKTELQGKVDTIEASVGLSADGKHITTSGNYTSGASTIAGEIAALDTQVKKNADAITAETSRATEAEAGLQEAIDAEEARATAAEEALQKAIDTVEGAAISVAAGNGISVTGDGTTKTIAALAKADDPVIEVTADGIGVKEDAVIDCGTYA